MSESDFSFIAKDVESSDGQVRHVNGEPIEKDKDVCPASVWEDSFVISYRGVCAAS